MHALDRTDAIILLARDRAPDASIMEIASTAGISRNTVHARLRRLRESGVQRPASTTVSAASLGRPLLAFVALSVRQRDIETVYAALRAIPEVVEAHTTTGVADLMVRVVARDTVDLHHITQRIQAVPGVHRSDTSVATTEVIPPRTAPLLRELVDSPQE